MLKITQNFQGQMKDNSAYSIEMFEERHPYDLHLGTVWVLRENDISSDSPRITSLNMIVSALFLLHSASHVGSVIWLVLNRVTAYGDIV